MTCQIRSLSLYTANFADADVHAESNKCGVWDDIQLLAKTFHFMVERKVDHWIKVDLTSALLQCCVRLNCSIVPIISLYV